MLGDVQKTLPVAVQPVIVPQIRVSNYLNWLNIFQTHKLLTDNK
jgi:hypothetical protein